MSFLSCHRGICDRRRPTRRRRVPDRDSGGQIREQWMEPAGRADGALPDDPSLHNTSCIGGSIRSCKRFHFQLPPPCPPRPHSYRADLDRGRAKPSDNIWYESGHPSGDMETRPGSSHLGKRPRADTKPLGDVSPGGQLRSQGTMGARTAAFGTPAARGSSNPPFHHQARARTNRGCVRPQ